MRTPKKSLNLNKLKMGCSPCFNKVRQIERKIANRELSEIKIEENSPEWYRTNDLIEILQKEVSKRWWLEV